MEKSNMVPLMAVSIVAIVAIFMAFGSGTPQTSSVGQATGLNQLTSGGVLACVDSDGGDNPFAAGRVQDRTGIFYDDCASGEHLEEWYCDGKNAQVRFLSCTGATGGVGCVNNECIRCGDTDGGDEPFVAGTTFVQGQSESDYCNSGEHLTEFYCDENGNIASRSISCTGQTGGSGCSEGACYN